MTTLTTERPLRGYEQSISDATGITDRTAIARIEDWMRNIIFHSTLDWQTREQFAAAARESVRDLRAYAIGSYFGAI